MTKSASNGAKITASVYTSHVPAIGVAIDMDKRGEAYWQPLFKGYEYSQQWLKDNKPDVIFLVYKNFTKRLQNYIDYGSNAELEPLLIFAIGSGARNLQHT